MGYSRTKRKGARARLGGAPGCAHLCHPSLRGPRLLLRSYLRLPKLQSWTIPWDSNAVFDIFIIFCKGKALGTRLATKSPRDLSVCSFRLRINLKYQVRAILDRGIVRILEGKNKINLKPKRQLTEIP